jgi:hypothetical protein
MTKGEKELNKVIEFMQECEQYLHSWCCTRNGKYLPVDTQNVRKVLMNIVANGSKNPIKEFKNGIEDGTIILGTFAFGLPSETKNLLYEKHCENVKKFEKKYKI